MSSAPSGHMIGRLRALQRPISVGIVGIGSMGKGLLYQASITPGFRCVAIADIALQKAIDSARSFGLPHCVVHTESEMVQAIRRGELAICEDAGLVAACSEIAALIDSSGAILEAASFLVTAIESGKHLVMMNAEADLIFGPYLMRLARQRRVVYSSCDGDQHGCIKRIADDMQLWGLDLVMAGNIKGFLDRYSNPTKIVPEADQRNLDYRMATAYTDGTKLCVEMALLANALGLRALAPGMHGPRAESVQDVFRLFDFESIWKSRRPVVDYIIGAAPSFGVFAIGRCDHPYQRAMLEYLKRGPGPFYLFYRPYHLCHIEAMQCVAEAVLDGHSLLEPLSGFQTNVYAYAKRDLRAGELLDGIGGYASYGLIENCGSLPHPGLPICLSEGLTLRCGVARDAAILMEHVNLPERRADFDFYVRSQSQALVA